MPLHILKVFKSITKVSPRIEGPPEIYPQSLTLTTLQIEEKQIWEMPQETQEYCRVIKYLGNA